MDHDDRTADTGMLSSDAGNPGPAATPAGPTPTQPPQPVRGHPVTTTAMSDADPDRTRLGTRERGNARQ